MERGSGGDREEIGMRWEGTGAMGAHGVKRAPQSCHMALLGDLDQRGLLKLITVLKMLLFLVLKKM